MYLCLNVGEINQTDTLLKKAAEKRMQENLERMGKMLDMISESQLWQRPNNNSNSICNIVLHLNGNITQYILSALGGEPDHRKRKEEFSTKGGISKSQLLSNHTTTVNSAIQIIHGISHEGLRKLYHVQAYEMDGVDIILHVVEHYSYHVGQVAFWVKQLKAQELGFYSGIDLDQTQ